MKISLLSAREVRKNPFEILEETYPSFPISDAVLLDYGKQVYLGFTGLKKPAPILRNLLCSASFSVFLRPYIENKGVLLLSPDGLIEGEKKITLSEEIKKEVSELIPIYNAFGGVLNADGSHTIDLFSPAVGPHYGINLLLGWREHYRDPLLRTPKSVVDSLGRGSFRAQAAYQVLATRWDIRPEENGNPFNRQFYLLENGKQIFYSAEITDDLVSAQCTHYPNKTVISYQLKDGLKVERTVFLLAQLKGLPDAVEVQTVRIVSKQARKLRIVFTGTFGFSAPECQQVDVIYQTVIQQSMTLNDENGRLIGLTPSYYPEYFKRLPRFAAFVSDAGPLDDFTNDATSFLGKGSIEHPENLARLENAYQRKGASFFAFGKTFDLLPNVAFSLACFTGVVDAEKSRGTGHETLLAKQVGALLRRFPSGDALMTQLQKQDAFLKDYSSFFQVRSGNKAFDAMINANIPFQTLYQSFVSRAFAQTQKGYREIGFREIQDLYASLPYLISSHREKLAKELLSNWIKNVFHFGYANHNFFFIGKEPGMCSDDPLWLFPAVTAYVKLTGDKGILDEEFDMADGGKRSLKDTLKAILVYSNRISVGKHGLPLLDKADWNDTLKIDPDCLDGPTKEKRYADQLKKNGGTFGVSLESDLSESTMNAFILARDLNETIELAQAIHDEDLGRFAIESRKNLVKAIQSSAFIDGYFARVLINREHPKNNIRYVGAPGDGLSRNVELSNGSIYLNSLSWSLLGDVAEEKQIESMLLLADRFLKTPSGYRLCSEEDLTLTGAKEAATSHYFPGDRENGGVFKHATMMFTCALLHAAKKPYDEKLRERMVDDAFEMLHLAYPFRCMENPYVYKGNPRFCTQYNNPVTQENIGPILSGTATWLTLSLFESSGVSFGYNGFQLHPILEKAQGDYAFSLRLQGSLYHIEVHKKANAYAFHVRSLVMDGVPLAPESFIPYLCDEKEHFLIVELF